MNEGDSEFVFELQTCRWAELHWPPEDESPTNAVLVARQLGTKRRRWDTIVLEADPEGLRQRRNFGEQRLDSDLLHVVQHAPEAWAWYQDALPYPGYPWRYVRETIHQAADRGILDVRKDGNRLQIRRKWEYPDWVDRIVAIENKPDLDASAARALGNQIEYDVAMGLADEVWVATRATGERVEPALLERLPVEAGILSVQTGAATNTNARDLSATVEWFPRSLSAEDPGTRILERPSGGKYDASAARFEYADPDWKADKRLAIAERAFEKGWRSYHDTMRPDCRHFELKRVGRALLPWCPAKGRHQTDRQCSGSCSEFAPEPPQWRTNGWPIEGGPGKGIQRLLQERRERERSE
ncbi:DUF5787 family protein [Halorussus halophilus]|uniref:DUF5787 family protein n=1 Tax=Halorussus halophilus TaxID=2650975 RepID=UPI001300D4BF|nr:DUF5787 family protein [Halorussus halophilus]